ncbi:MAG: Glu-tRNA(Gln) amidotransferase subunit GatD [Desulfurococcaceae archaeon]|nr:Glu-tRNA(Gln) amidotransferase subunit GatD [Desulfurococcaceae archaeon]
MRVYYGYTGALAELLASRGLKPGDRISILLRDNTTLRGILMPRPGLFSEQQVLVVKLENGYNTGIRIDEILEVSLLEQHPPRREPTISRPMHGEGMLPSVAIISTGGTIASKVDYETGAVTPALTAEEIIEWIPELSEIASISVEELMSIFSEDMEPKYWEKIADSVYRHINSGVSGVVVAHGTDTMTYTASALAFAIQEKPAPIVLVGSQRSSDRPSTDAVFNLLSAVLVAAKAPFAESVITMHASSSDPHALVLRGVKARKMHTSRRDAFKPINDTPIAYVDPVKREIKIIGEIVEHRNPGKTPVLKNKFDDRVALVKAYPGIQSEIIDFLVDKGFHGIVIEGTGLGHIANKVIDSIKRAVDSGIPVVMTSQCLFGRVNLNVYSTGRRLLEAGVIPGGDMLPETSYVKLSWILGSLTRDPVEVRSWITRNIAGELNERHTLELYPRWTHE